MVIKFIPVPEVGGIISIAVETNNMSNKLIHIVTLNEESYEFGKELQDWTVDDVIENAMTTFHEINAHIENDSGNTNNDHSLFFGNTSEYDIKTGNYDNYDPVSPACQFYQELKNKRSDIESKLNQIKAHNNGGNNNGTTTKTF